MSVTGTPIVRERGTVAPKPVANRLTWRLMYALGSHELADYARSVGNPRIRHSQLVETSKTRAQEQRGLGIGVVATAGRQRGSIEYMNRARHVHSIAEQIAGPAQWVYGTVAQNKAGDVARCCSTSLPRLRRWPPAMRISSAIRGSIGTGRAGNERPM